MNQDSLLIAASDVSLVVGGVAMIKSIMDVVVMLLLSVDPLLRWKAKITFRDYK